MMDIEKVLKNNRLSRALIGMNRLEFETLLITFEKTLYEELASKDRKRKVGGGYKGILLNGKVKLFFVLFYLKVYPTFDLAGFVFGTIRSVTCEWIQKFLPILEKTLGRACVLPKKKISSPEEFFRAFPGIKDIFIDGTERPVQRPKNNDKQKKKYSGKKKRHTRKNTIICDDKKKILCVSGTHDGKIHDKKQLEKMGILENIPDEIAKWLDKGYQGLQNYIKNIVIPHKKPRKKSLSEEQKAENKIISGIRITVEHAIAGIKRFRCLTDTFRNKNGLDDMMFKIATGIWNLHLNLAK